MRRREEQHPARAAFGSAAPAWLALSAALAGATCILPSYESGGICPIEQTAPFVARFGENQEDAAYDVATGACGDIVVGGLYSAYMSFDGEMTYVEAFGAGDAFVAKYDPAGALQWSRQFGDASPQHVERVAVGPSGEVIAAGHFMQTMDFGDGEVIGTGKQDLFAVKLDASGNRLWNFTAGDETLINDTSLTGLAVDGAGDVLLIGNFAGTLRFGDEVVDSQMGSAHFLVKLSAAGGARWSQSVLGVEGRAVAVDRDSNVLITGRYGGSPSLGGEPLPGGGRVFVAKYTAAGDHLWSRGFSVNGDLATEALAVNGEGEVVVAGAYWGRVDFGDGPSDSVSNSWDAFVLKLTPAGSTLWSHRFGGEDTQSGTAIAVDAAGDVLVAGTLRGTIDLGDGPRSSRGETDLFVAALAGADGAPRSGFTFGDEMTQERVRIAAGDEGRAILGGGFAGSLDLGAGALVSRGLTDIFLAKLAPPFAGPAGGGGGGAGGGASGAAAP